MKCSSVLLTSRMSSILALVMSLAAIASLSGCASEIKEIDRTQVNRLKKADLRGVWYEVGVVTELPPSANFGFAGQTNFGGDSGKVMFDIQENYLVVYPVTEKVVGGDSKWTKRKFRKYWDAEVMGRPDRSVKDSDFIEIFAGNPVGMYPIKSHFDVIRDYSATTGEQTNVTVENTSDRPWWQREYIRVDWSKNSLTNLMFPQGTMSYSSVDYFVPAGSDDKSPDNPSQFYMAPERDYFHFTRRLYGQPMSTGACSPYSLATGDCSGAVMEVRISFRRADPKHINDYEIRYYPNDPAQEKFGFFMSERYRFDEDYGLIYSGKDSKAERWNIWSKSKILTPLKDAAGKPITCMTNRDCAAPAVCDQKDWFELGTCSSTQRMEYSKRGLRPIIYHISTDHPVDHLPAVYMTADDWSDVFKETVSWLYFWEKKWSEDGVGGFTNAQSRFGQRFCATNADCAAVAAAGFDIPTPVKANRVAVPISKTEVVVVEDCVQDSKGNCTDRAKLSGKALVALVNATPGSTATLNGLPAGTIEAKYDNSLKDGKVVARKAIDVGKLVDGASLATLDLTVDVGGKAVAVPNVKIGPDSVTFIVVSGANAAVLTSTGNSKSGLRVVNGFATGDFEVGVNGARMVQKLEAGRGSDFLFAVGNVAQVAFVQAGHRADVTCATIKGVGQCIGWKQQLVSADLEARKQIKASLPPIFALCENQFTRSYDSCKASGEAGNPKALNDCRYWVADGAAYGHAGKPFNPCADKKAGGLVPEAAKMKIHGDARYNYMYWVTKINAASPLGYGPAAGDPDTGEIFWATANVYGASQLTYAQYAKDLVDLLNGDIDPKSMIAGSYIKAYMEKEDKASHDKSLYGAIGDGLPTDPQKEELAARARSTLHLKDRAAAMANQGKVNFDEMRNTVDYYSDMGHVNEWLVKNLPAIDLDALTARAEKIKGTSVEAGLINDEMALVMSEGEVQPGVAMNPEMIDKISPVGWASPKGALTEAKRMRFLGLNNITMAEFQDPSIIGLAKRLKCDPGEEPTDVWDGDTIGKDKCYKGDALRTALSVALYAATIEHEVGHTVGLRHNFSASSDALNYFDDYYDEDKGGRERELVACAEVQINGGTLPADNFCETEELGEKCIKISCKSDKDCATGASCAAGKCIDADGTEVGVCQSLVWHRVSCSDDSACGGGVCSGGYCQDRVTCTAASQCAGGDTCESGYCVDGRTKAPRTALKLAQETAPARKYLSRAGLTEKEQQGRRMEKQYSTVMDYGQKINSDILGLGKYDYAAIKYGYGELTEVYHDTTFLHDRTVQATKARGWTFEQMSGRMDTGGWKNSLYPQFNYLNDWMPPEYNKQRDAVPDIWVAAEHEFAGNYFRGIADYTYFEVPYKYCSDEYRGGSMACYYFDTGATMEEIVHHAGEALREYYLFDAFKRERTWFGMGGSPASYRARILDRWLTPIQAAGRYYAIYNNIFGVYSWFPSIDLIESRLLPMRRASENSFRILTNMIATPAPGSYVLDKKQNAYVNVSYDTGRPDTQLNIDMGVGKYPWTTFATKAGYYMYNHPQWIGAYWDKITAIGVMTNSTAGFLSEYVGEQLPVFRATAIGYNTIYPTQLAQVLGGLVAGDIQQFAGATGPAAGGGTEYKPFDPFAPVSATAARVMPSVINQSVRLFAAWQAIANLPAGFDPSYTDSLAIWLKGHGPEFTVGQGAIGGKPVKMDLCEFQDPFGDKTYVAPRPNYSAERYSAAYAMCRKLNAMKSGCVDGSVCQPCAPGNSGCTIGTCADSTACRGDNWLTKATGPDKEVLVQQMKAEIEILDYLRTLYSVYGNIGAGTN